MLRTAFLLLAGAAHGAVIGIDLGSRFLKVGIIQPGTGIELVLNEATQRKSSSAAGFNSQVPVAAAGLPVSSMLSTLCAGCRLRRLSRACMR